jgi:hypothetical protein
MVWSLVPQLLKWNIGVLFGVLKGPRSDTPISQLAMVLHRCDVYFFPFYCVLRHCIVDGWFQGKNRLKEATEVPTNYQENANHSVKCSNRFINKVMVSLNKYGT